MKNKMLFSKNDEEQEVEIKEKTVKPFDRRNRSLKMISVYSAILFIAIAIIFNIVFESLFGAQLIWDWTQTDMFSVGEVTTELVGKLDKDVRIVGLYDKETISAFADVEILLDKYVKLSKGKITVQYINPIKTPSIIKQLDPEDVLKPTENNFVIQCEATKKAKIITYTDIYQTEYDENYQQQITGVTAEKAFSGAILYTTSEKTPVVYMTKGQQELDYNTSYTTMTAILQDNNFIVKDLDLLTAKSIPEDAELLIMLSPKKDINNAETNILDEYLRKGKGLLVMCEYNNATFPKLNTILADYNIEISNNRIREVDIDRIYQDDAYSFIADVPVSLVTKEAADSSTLVQNARVINQLNNEKTWLTVNAILQTGEKALSEENGDPEKTGEAFIMNIGVASENKGFMDGTTVKTSTKVIVIGSTVFMGDELLSAVGSQVYNMYAFYTSIRWLTNGETNDLMITAKALPSYKLTGGGTSAVWVASIICIIVIPFGLLIAAMIVYRKRKNL